MTLVKKKNFNELSELIGKTVHFMSDCELMPLDIVCKVKSLSIKNNEIIFNVITKTGKTYTIGGNQSNLAYNIISKK